MSAMKHARFRAKVDAEPMMSKSDSMVMEKVEKAVAKVKKARKGKKGKRK